MPAAQHQRRPLEHLGGAEPTRIAGPLSTLAREVLAALVLRDAGRLRALPLSEAEFRKHVWPELPASRPERNVPFDYAWEQMKQRSDGHLRPRSPATATGG